MVMFASTNVFTAGPEPPGPEPTLAVAGSVSRVNDTPPTTTVTDAFPVTWPADGDVNVIVHCPDRKRVVKGEIVELPKAAPLLIVRVTTGWVPFGTFTNPALSPAFCFAVIVNVCG